VRKKAQLPLNNKSLRSSACIRPVCCSLLETAERGKSAGADISQARSEHELFTRPNQQHVPAICPNVHAINWDCPQKNTQFLAGNQSLTKRTNVL
jgi:hypothetical protein